ncbi:Hypothetical protein P9303_29411 [Prochlorococcus marinus str. MIT 9303]|uniref:Uncharacterized protein n=1 Tax=Prochlorococcus marinus (strain MIT 9303) TaxID=59922 RepID=A2CDW1_PROM3|nr:Hypothetical protein P9303_29411 [Prochlorococcus marinus str. MIT 9303]
MIFGLQLTRPFDAGNLFYWRKVQDYWKERRLKLNISLGVFLLAKMGFFSKELIEIIYTWKFQNFRI